MEPAQTLYQCCSTPGRSYARNMCVGFGAGPDTKSNQSRRHIPRRCLVIKASRMSQSCNPGESATSKVETVSTTTPIRSTEPPFGTQAPCISTSKITAGFCPQTSKMYTRPGVPPFKLIGSISLGLLTVSDFLPHVYPTIAFSLSRSFSGNNLAIADRFDI